MKSWKEWNRDWKVYKKSKFDEFVTDLPDFVGFVKTFFIWSVYVLFLVGCVRWVFNSFVGASLVQSVFSVLLLVFLVGVPLGWWKRLREWLTVKLGGFIGKY